MNWACDGLTPVGKYAGTVGSSRRRSRRDHPSQRTTTTRTTHRYHHSSSDEKPTDWPVLLKRKDFAKRRSDDESKIVIGLLRGS